MAGSTTSDEKQSMTALSQVGRQRTVESASGCGRQPVMEGTTVMDSYHISGNGQVQVSLMLLGSGPAALGTEHPTTTLKTWGAC
jgi:hypothetical protein